MSVLVRSLADPSNVAKKKDARHRRVDEVECLSVFCVVSKAVLSIVEACVFNIVFDVILNGLVVVF